MKRFIKSTLLILSLLFFAVVFDAHITHAQSIPQPSYIPSYDAIGRTDSTQRSITSPTITCADITEIPSNECNALQAILAATNGYLSWFQTDTPCNWLGIHCNAGHIEELYIGGWGQFELQVTAIPPEIRELTHLKKLGYSGGNLSTVPPEIGSLINLTKLSLVEVKLTTCLSIKFFGKTEITD